MTVALRVVLDPIIAPVPGGIGRYTEELTRALIQTAPAGCEVRGIVSASPQADYDTLATLLPGLAELSKSSLARRELRKAWQHGLIAAPGAPGMLHATSLLAPLSRHDRVNDPDSQSVVTIHDTIAWTHPEAVNPKRVAWHKSMAKRAMKFADAVVVPSHAVAHELSERLDFGDRIRVIGGAVSSRLNVPLDADARAEALALPDRYVLTAGTLEPRKGLAPLIRSLADSADSGLPLLVAGPHGWGDVDVAAIAAEAGVDADRVRSLGVLSDADLAVALSRATVFVYPSLAEGFGLPILEAFHLGTPVVHSDAPALVELAAGAGLEVARDDAAGYPRRLAEAIKAVVMDERVATRLSTTGSDRAGGFRWRDSADKVWLLHADL